MNPNSKKGREHLGKGRSLSLTLGMGLDWGLSEELLKCPLPLTLRATLGKFVLVPLGPTRSLEAGGKEREKGRGGPRAGGITGKGLPWGTAVRVSSSSEALAASQVLILGYFQPLSIPLCCVCPSSSCYPDPCIVTLLCSCSLPLTLSASPILPLPHREYNIFSNSLKQPGMQDSHAPPCTRGYSPTGPRERQPLACTHPQRHKAHISKRKEPSLGSGSPQSF